MLAITEEVSVHKELLSPDEEMHLSLQNEFIASDEEMPLCNELLGTDEEMNELVATDHFYDEMLVTEEVPIHGQLFAVDNLSSPLYNGASVTLQQTLAKYFEWFTSHPGTSKEAMSGMLRMQQSILPEGNLLPRSYPLARRLLEPLLVKTEVFHACPNDCILFRNEYAEDTVCPKCKANRYINARQPIRKFIYLPIGPRLIRMFGSKNIARLLQDHFASSSTEFMYDIHHSPTWAEAYSCHGIFSGDLRGISFGFCTDGVNPFSHNRVSYSMWPMMLTLLNLPRELRNSFSSIFLLGIVTGNGSQEPKSIDPYIEVVVDELLQLSSTATIHDAHVNAPFKLKAEILLYILDYPAIGEVFRMSGSGAYKGCIWCDIKGKLANN